MLEAALKSFNLLLPHCKSNIRESEVRTTGKAVARKPNERRLASRTTFFALLHGSASIGSNECKDVDVVPTQVN